VHRAMDFLVTFQNSFAILSALGLEVGLSSYIFVGCSWSNISETRLVRIGRRPTLGRCPILSVLAMCNKIF
jgi:hypothetical protein